MLSFQIIPCLCGSGLESEVLLDARGIYCCRVCPSCIREKKAQYRPAIFTDPSYDCDEQIEPDE